MNGDVRLSNSSIHSMVTSYCSTIFSSILNLLFVLTLPLVIIGFYSNQNLQPIKSSVAKFFNHFAMYKFVIVLLLVQYSLGWLPKLLIPEAFIYYGKTLLPFLTTPLSFLVLMYSFLLITDYFMTDLEFDLEK